MTTKGRWITIKGKHIFLKSGHKPWVDSAGNIKQVPEYTKSTQQFGKTSIDLKEAVPGEYIFHNTSEEALKGIIKSGGIKKDWEGYGGTPTISLSSSSELKGFGDVQLVFKQSDIKSKSVRYPNKSIKERDKVDKIREDFQKENPNLDTAQVWAKTRIQNARYIQEAEQQTKHDIGVKNIKHISVLDKGNKDMIKQIKKIAKGLNVTFSIRK